MIDETSNFIPYGTQWIDDDDISALIETLKKGYLTCGSKVTEFEAELCRATGAKYAVAVANGTAALHISAIALGLQPDMEVITTPITFAATANAILYCGATPIFADIDPGTMLLDIADVERKITPHTKAIFPVHFSGELCDMDALSALAKQYNLKLLQDCAHSLGGTIRGEQQGKFDDLQIWSFHPVKTITTGEGGAVTTNNAELYQKLIRLRSHGITREQSLFECGECGDWYYEMLDLGYNYRITDIQCALGISQLKKLKLFADRRKKIVTRYNSAFESLPVEVQVTAKWSEPCRHLYTIRVKDKSQRKSIYNCLKERNIGVNVHYIPVYWLPYYRKLGYKHGLCPNAEDAYERMITIPLYPKMTDEQVEYVIACIKEAVV